MTDVLHDLPPGVEQPQAAELTAEGIVVRFQGLTAISDVSLECKRHQVFGLIGPNGAGKTTLVNCLTGFQRPTSGRVRLGGEDTTGWTPDRFRKNGVARTFQAGRLFRDMTVAENVEVTALGLGMSRRAAHRHAMAMLAWVGLGDRADTIAGTLPYTDERRVGIARAMVLSPAFVLLDEPAAGMSDAECDDLMHIIAAIPKEFTCGVLLIEHNMSVIMGVCDRIHVLDGGRTIAEGLPAEIRADAVVISAYLGMEG
ncbi:MAG: ABC transporter ATP-binding protein [Alphaproteobacteria bacterium]|nr:ABC transporter ATP-binding protein [Alphaproteobacteria bacterium]